MKKLISLTLALMLVFSLATVAMAATQNPDGSYVDESTITIQKTYNATNTGTTSPAETITFTVTKKSITGNDAASWPADVKTGDGGVTVDNLTLAAGAADGTKRTVTIHLPRYTDVGIYTYEIQENGTNKAGVTYFGDKITLVVTVIEQNGKVRVAAVHTETPVSPSYGQDGSKKSDTFVNTYSAGSLSVKKTVTGNLGDQTKYFAITVSLTDTTNDGYGTDYTGNTITVGATSYNVSDGKGGTITNPTTITVGTPATFYLKHDETLTLSNIPYGTEYTVTEANLDDYVETITGGDNNNGTGVVDAANEALVTVTNNKEVPVDTGITLDSLPFVLILAVCAGAVVLFVIKRRNSVEF